MLYGETVLDQSLANSKLICYGGFLKLYGFIFVMYFAEIIFGGAGMWSLAALGVDIRKIMFLVLFSFSSWFLYFNNKLKLLDFLILMVLMVFSVLTVAILPFLNVTNFYFVIGDATPIVSMIVFLWIMVAGFRCFEASDVNFFDFLTKWIFIFSTLLSLLHVMIFVALHVVPDIGYSYVDLIKSIFDPNEAGNVFIGPMPDGSVRVFWISSLFIVFGLYRSAVKILHQCSFFGIAIFLINAGALLATQTRSLIFAIPCGIIVGSLFLFFLKRNFISNGMVALGVVILFLLTTVFTSIAASPDLISLLGIAREGSDDERFLQIMPLMHTWGGNLIFGVGFGAQAEYIRSESAPYSYEMSMLALYMKVGILGLILFNGYFLYLIESVFSNRRVVINSNSQFILFFSFVFVFFMAFNTNPYFSSSVGISIVVLCFIELKRLSLLNFNV